MSDMQGIIKFRLTYWLRMHMISIMSCIILHYGSRKIVGFVWLAVLKLLIMLTSINFNCAISWYCQLKVILTWLHMWANLSFFFFFKLSLLWLYLHKVPRENLSLLSWIFKRKKINLVYLCLVIDSTKLLYVLFDLVYSLSLFWSLHQGQLTLWLFFYYFTWQSSHFSITQAI